jgi:type I restriction-modification system DNA methylase subunit
MTFWDWFLPKKKPKRKLPAQINVVNLNNDNPKSIPPKAITAVSKPEEKVPVVIKQETTPTEEKKPTTPEPIKPKYNPPPARNHEKEFIKIFNNLTYHHSSWEVWRDFITMYACAISNTVDKNNYDKREELYLKTIKKYNNPDQHLFPELVGILVMALEQNPEQDFLGHLYMTLELNNSAKAQFFTPYNISQLMAEISLGDAVKQVEEQGYITVNDPCCGAGVMLIAVLNSARKQLGKAGLNFQNHILITGQDIDSTSALMCYIQISLLGAAGYVKVGNSLTEPMAEGDSLEKYWFTPMYFSDVWNTRRIIQKMNGLFEEKREIENHV